MMANLNPKSCKVIQRMSEVIASKSSDHFRMASLEVNHTFQFSVGKAVESLYFIGVGEGD